MSCQFYVLQSRSGNRYMCVGARVQIYKEKKQQDRNLKVSPLTTTMNYINHDHHK